MMRMTLQNCLNPGVHLNPHPTPGMNRVSPLDLGMPGMTPGGWGSPLKRFKGKIALSSEENWKMTTVYLNDFASPKLWA
jgi:hypothetical protein